MMWNIERLKFDEPVITHKNTNKVDNVLRGVIGNYYQSIDKPYIFDREKCWGTPANFNLIRTYIDPSPKIVLTVRKITDVLLSFLQVMEDYSWVDREMEDLKFLPVYHRTKNDARCDYLMLADSSIEKSLLGIKLATEKETKPFFHLVEYDDLINNPKQTLQSIYNFLELDYYEHNFYNIKPEELVDDTKGGFPKDLHKIAPILKKQKHKKGIELSNYVLNRYSNMEFWRE